jgi:hypothetical protein
MPSDFDQKVTLPDGRIVQRKAALFVKEWLALVAVAEYDKHFIYESNVVNQPAYMCTCGSVAGVVPRGPQGKFSCLHYINAGRHNV